MKKLFKLGHYDDPPANPPSDDGDKEDGEGGGDGPGPGAPPPPPGKP